MTSRAQFAYNETSFMLVRLLQHISAIEFTPEVAPESVIPSGYNDSPGSDGTDRVCIRSHLTAFVKVRACCCPKSLHAKRTCYLGRSLDQGHRDGERLSGQNEAG